MQNQKKKILIILGAAALFLFAFVVFQQDSSHLPTATYHLPQEENKELRLTVAGCPTFYYILDKLSNDWIRVVKTGSAAESFYLFQQGEIDLVLAGRALRPGEPKLSFKIIGPGYSFISNKELLIQEKEMGNYNFFTDLSSSEIINQFPYIIQEKISEVENVYDYLNEGIVITSVKNTDYSKSEIVHIYTKDGSRHRFSRTPIIYYSKTLNNLDYLKIQDLEDKMKLWFE